MHVNKLPGIPTRHLGVSTSDLYRADLHGFYLVYEGRFSSTPFRPATSNCEVYM